MATWFDLPTEVKQLICKMITDVESIIYVPRDRRRKVDFNYESVQHFHDILLVAKNFIAPEELAFAILRKAAVTFYNSNQLRRLVGEVNPAFKECIRRIDLNRSFHPDTYPSKATDSFESLTKISAVISSMPNLRQIRISWDDYCAPLGQYAPRNWQGEFISMENQSEILKYALRRNPEDDVPSCFNPEKHVDILGNVVASFIGNRTTGTPRHLTGHEGALEWTRPHSWIRCLVQHAEAKNIEVIFNVTLCIAGCFVQLDSLDSEVVIKYPGILRTAGDTCWSNRHPLHHGHHRGLGHVEMHTQAQMSTIDYILRVKDHEDREYAFYQYIAYQMLHAKPRASYTWWDNLLGELKYDPNHGPRRRPLFAF